MEKTYTITKSDVKKAQGKNGKISRVLSYSAVVIMVLGVILETVDTFFFIIACITAIYLCWLSGRYHFKSLFCIVDKNMLEISDRLDKMEELLTSQNEDAPAQDDIIVIKAREDDAFDYARTRISHETN